MTPQLPLVFDTAPARPFKRQLLKWVGNKQRFAHEIAAVFPQAFGTYFELFLGSGAVLATLAPARAVASDGYRPLVEIWTTLKADPERLERWYAERHDRFVTGGRAAVYEEIRTSFNRRPNGADLLFLCRSCYGGVVRFRQSDGAMSTPCGPHKPIPPEEFSRRVNEWALRFSGTEVVAADFEDALDRVGRGDLVCCDPPYQHSQSILYGAQSFDPDRLWRVVERCKRRGAFVAVSIDGTKRSGRTVCDISTPSGLFQRETTVNCGRSMLRRFQRNGETLEDEVVTDRLLLTY